MEGTFKKAVWEVSKAAMLTAAFCLFFEAIFALIIRACTPTSTTITAVNWVVKCVAAFAFCMLSVRRGRAFFKGLAAGTVSVILTMLLFALIGGGFHVDILFLPELVLSALAGGFGAILGAKLRKE